MSSLMICPNELLEAIAIYLPLNDLLALRATCPRIEESIRSLIRRKHFTVHEVAFSEAGLVRLLRRTQCQRFLKGTQAMTIRFQQAPLFYLDELKSSVLKRLYQAFLASPWRESGPLPAMVVRRVEQWELYTGFFKAQRRFLEENTDLRLLGDIMSNIGDGVATVNVEYEEATEFAPIMCGDELYELFAAINAIDMPRVSQSTRLCDMVQKAGNAVGLVRIN
ncbi:uncharacterized protein M437DRAFT_89346 [Aureobasidium melanogenum CBS 110374]|uniref:F-box domain-containing protein n=1 Tax=Aureobasidium melanogenum (strain CBS 110374) TaxID=1043003 RepID=A0A074VIV5_AURM1|nr:uncharacterized protein M437DRAFT_89346 [Aureobasidium melanogenum CBS 110374]KEQ57532.1 hypothetical protein M437DRAFT_89346 [Aureobasidium melanogenum CBS 110374]